jgi:hypothetical protein
VTNGQRQYRKFLQSDFWKRLSKEKKDLVGKCEECGESNDLESHHLVYRDDWYKTLPEDLQVLCCECHRKIHGVPNKPMFCGGVMIYRDDLQFSRFIHWSIYLRCRMFRLGEGLKKREIWYLRMARRMYPPTSKDSCIKFHVKKTIEISRLSPSFK